MNVVFTPHAWDDYLYWQKTDNATLKRVNLLIKDCLRSPLEGLGKPEALKHQLAGYWSRRISDEHRLVYAVDDDQLVIVSVRYHYG
ncbi:Txe/YoeB family addiction module toxin [Arthrobacter castelli]|uniref:Txe/YoeB family addiction module toxin n=1 Tax=Arthrobacter castelli TaxID=271431 RepID=UPI0004043643|nr:Txe/YoeB family addiction module toxin [Arthrobacter castelli]